MSALTAHYEAPAQYMRWQDSGRVLAADCGARPDMNAHSSPRKPISWDFL